MYTHKHAHTEHLALILLRGSGFSSRIWQARLLGPGVISKLGAAPPCFQALRNSDLRAFQVQWPICQLPRVLEGVTSMNARDVALKL